MVLAGNLAGNSGSESTLGMVLARNLGSEMTPGLVLAGSLAGSQGCKSSPGMDLAGTLAGGLAQMTDCLPRPTLEYDKCGRRNSLSN